MKSRFIDREEQIDHIKAMINNLRSGGDVHHRFIEYYGIAGIGKTSLIKRLESLCSEIGINKAKVKFPEECNAEGIALLVKSICKAIDPQLINSEYKCEIDEFELTCQKVSWDSELILLCKKISSGFLSLIQGNSLVILLDDLNNIKPEVLHFMENELFVDLITLNPIIVVYTSQKKIGWTNYSLKYLSESSKLPPLSKKDGRIQIEGLGIEDGAEEILDITNGHPLSNVLVKTFLDENNLLVEKRLKSKGFGDYETRLVEYLKRAVVDSKIMQSVDPGLQEIIYKLSVSRKINEEIISKIFPYLTWNLSAINDLVVKLKMTGMIDIDHTSGDYLLDSTIRIILALHMRLVSPQSYIDITEKLISVYERHLQDKLVASDIVNALFHNADLLRLRDKSYDVVIVTNQIQQLKNWLLSHLWKFKRNDSSLIPELENVMRLITSDGELLSRTGYKVDSDEGNIFCDTIDSFLKELKVTKRCFLTIEKYYDYRVDEKGNMVYGKDDKNEIKNVYGVKFEIEGESVPLSTAKVEVKQRLIDHIMEEINNMQNEEDLKTVGLLIYTSFLNVEFQNRLQDIRNPLTISLHQVGLPLELMHNNNDFLSLQISLGRRELTSREVKITSAKRNPPLKFLLIGVGNSIVSSSMFDRLDFVKTEIESISHQLENITGKEIDFNPDEDSLLDEKATGFEFIKRLASGKYDVIHFAGHSFDSGNKSSSLVLYDEVITADQLEMNLQGRPLVFLNTCKSAPSHTNDSESYFVGETTYGLGHAFTNGGALACVGNLWKIPDTVASNFAETFYRNILQGSLNIGDCLRQTRTEIRLQRTDPIAWASYVLYGDPTLRLL